MRFFPIFFALISFSYAADSDVLDLSSFDVAGFKNELAKHDTILVEFFAPWCGHCKRLAPEYAKAAGVLASNDPVVPLAKVDCTADEGKDVCQEYGVGGYPTLKIFKGGEFAQEYNGPREADGIVKYMQSQVGPASQEYTSYEKLAERVSKAKEAIVVGLFASGSELAKKFDAAANKLRESVAFVHLDPASATGDIDTLNKAVDSTLTPPSINLVRPSLLKNKFEPRVAVYDDAKSVAEFVTDNYHGLVGHRTRSNSADFKNPLVIVYYDVDYVKNQKGTNYWRNRVLKVAQNQQKVNFAVANLVQFSGEAEEFGIEADKLPSGKDAVPVVAARDAEGKKYVLKEKFSVEVLENFVNDLIAGKLEPYFKSEDLPADNSGPVKVAVGKNFDELVTKTSKDILIEFYAPWCGHCKKLAPTWEELGKALQDEPNVDIVKMDATANDVPEPFVVHGFPTIYWYPADTKTPKKYEGGRDLPDLLKYIAQHSSKELVGYARDGSKRKEEL